ncbi:MAG TPA: hypothetical protein VNA14_08880 [Mycobacteriales bacterium]|nr:hypothetical protein [Mycobacteriales bacterium]
MITGKGGVGVRVAQLILGLVLCAVGIVMTLQSGLGVSPWDVLHGGLAERLDLSFGLVVQGVGLAVLVLGMVFGRVRPGFGTIANLILIGAVEDVLLATGWLDGLDGDALALRVAVLCLGTVVIGLGAALYIGAHLGAGPRDSVMVALHLRGRMSVGVARTIVEAVALGGGLLLGGPFGVGTVLYTITIGPAVQVWFRVLRMTPAKLPETTSEPI